ncbi:MAG: hypothetical protein KI790_13260, partial [Cyclobacteriaceae bacterium]|nr:hypothetical protein [Cyclobacteriaceae bacterium HetDA_MAG_MS6]
MSRDYSIYLENLKGRRYDEVLREPVLSEGFSRYEYGDAIRYALESMQEIDPAYTYKNYSTARRTQEIINNRLNETDLQVDFRYQGPISTNCHIQLYGDIELIVISRQYSKKPSKEVEVLAMEMVEALTATQLYKYVDYSERWKVNIKTLKPACEISILPAVWVDSSLYRETTREIDRGICEYNLSKRTRRMYLPFLNIARVNAMEKRVNGGLKCLTRLLRCLQRDAEDEIDLTYDEIIGSLYHLK